MNRPIRARAVAKLNVAYDKVSIALSPRPDTITLWGQIAYRTVDEHVVQDNPDEWLHLPEDEARALYEALAQYFGGDAVDARRLRQDYDHERARVDKFIDATIRTITHP